MPHQDPSDNLLLASHRAAFAWPRFAGGSWQVNRVHGRAGSRPEHLTDHAQSGSTPHDKVTRKARSAPAVLQYRGQAHALADVEQPEVEIPSSIDRPSECRQWNWLYRSPCRNAPRDQDFGNSALEQSLDQGVRSVTGQTPRDRPVAEIDGECAVLRRLLGNMYHELPSSCGARTVGSVVANDETRGALPED
jgi:hypothetical protein